VKQKADYNNIRRSILELHKMIVDGYMATMPSYQGVLNENELKELIVYLKLH